MAELDLEKRKRMVTNYADLTSTGNAASERDRDYYDGHQWTTDETKILQARKQPVITINRVRRKVDAMVGFEQRGRVDPRAYPRNPQDDDAAEAATKALTFVDDYTRFDTIKSACFENMLVEGSAAVEIGVEVVRGRYEISATRIRWEEFFYDPFAREKDFSDAEYLGVVKWMSLDAAISLYGGSQKPDGGEWDEADLEEVLSAAFAPTGAGVFDDRPETGAFSWADKKAKRVRIAQMYYKRGGTWYLAIFGGGGDIYNDVSPYKDEDGDPACAIIAASTYIDRDNARYGVVRDWISPQDEVNKRRSKLLHQLNSRQTLGVKGAVDSVTGMKRNLADPEGHVELNIEVFEDAIRAGVKPFEILQNIDQTSGQFSLLQEAKSEIDLVGPNPAVLGEAGKSQSGRALMVQQQAGFTEMGPVYDVLRDWTIRCYRAMWERIKQFWTEERWVRITDDVGAAQFFGLNVLRGYAQVFDMETGQPRIVPQVENEVARMDVDILIEDAPDYVTLRQEEFEQLSDMMQRGIQIPPEMLIEASSIRNKQELLELMKKRDEAAMQAAAQAGQIEAQGKAAKTSRDQAAAMKDAASADKIATETTITRASASLVGIG